MHAYVIGRRNYVKDVRLVVIDEIHLLGEDRGFVGAGAGWLVRMVESL